MVDFSEIKNRIATAYEGRAVRDAIVEMVQQVQDVLNGVSTTALSGTATITKEDDHEDNA